ncbi:MAG: FlgD immunoglobulin-like domain containing protein [bacterium]
MRSLSRFLLLFVTFAVTNAAATVLRVPEDFTSVRDAVLNSAAYDTVLVAPGDYVEGGQISVDSPYCLAPISHPLTLRSTDGADATRLELDVVPLGTPANRVLSIESPGGPVVIEGFTLRSHPNGNDSGLYAVSADSLVVRDTTFRDFWGSGHAVQVAGGTPAGSVALDGCQFRECGASHGEYMILVTGARPVEIVDCTVRRCVTGLSLPSGAALRRCAFEENEDRLVLVSSGLLEDCVFRGNQVGTRTELILATSGSEIRRCQILDNFAAGVNSVPGVQLHGNMSDCFLAGNTVAGGSASAALVFGAMDHCVVVGNSGRYAVYVSDPVNSGCSLFWQNPDGDTSSAVALSDLGWNLDPQLCSGRPWSPEVRSTSPCLPAQSVPCGSYPLFTEGCAPEGILLDTDPPHLQVLADGLSMTAPAYVEWVEGTVHEIAAFADQPDTVGRRFVFEFWDDGGAATHDIVVGPPGSRVTATHSPETLLTMIASPSNSGVLTPGTSWHPDGATVTIEAIPNFPFLFLNWTTNAPNGVISTDPVEVITLSAPVTQTATFVRTFPFTLQSDPPGVRMTADDLEIVSPESFDWYPGTLHTLSAGDPSPSSEGERFSFERWSDNVLAPTRQFTMPGVADSRTAIFDRQFRLDPFVVGDGTVSADTSWYSEGTTVDLVATPGDGWVFVGWIGGGDASYSGPEPAITLTMTSPVTETAIFEPAPVPLASIVLSLSDTDPDPAVGSTPLGLASVYLWLLCQDGDGLGSLTAEISGDIPVFGFTADPGVASNASLPELDLLVTDCPIAVRRLGSFLVLDQVGGSLCLVPSASSGLLQAADCNPSDPVTFTWPTSLSIRGIATDGSVPCESGTGCTPGRQPTSARVLADDLRGLRPNPFRGATSVEFALEQSEVVHLSVYDVAGRLVRRLASGPRSPGPQSVVWDARGEGGGRVPAGVYFVRLETARFAATRKAIVLE